MRRLCVFCGSSAGRDPAFAAAAVSVARALAGRDLGVIYGGGRVGLMGALADAALAAGGEVIGVIPRALMEREIGHEGLTALHVVDTMHERKALMADLSDGFIALPGGAGTLEELFEVFTWAQLGLHGKPCGLLDVLGYYDALTRFLDHAVEQGFLGADSRAMLLVDEDLERLLDRMAAYEPPAVAKWAGPTER